MKKNLIILGLLAASSLVYSQVGINTPTPQKQLHVNGSLQVTNEISLGGNASTAGTAGTAGQYLTSNGPGNAPTWQSPAGIVPTSNGTIIAINGQLMVAQEIKVQMTADYTITTVGVPFSIGNLNNEIIDNENKFTGNATGNSFTVSADGVYELTMNAQLILTAGNNPVIGIWNDTTNNWVARVNDTAATTLQTYTLITSIPMLASNTYSFRVASTSGNVTVRHLSTGGSGDGPVTQVSLRRLK